MSGDHAKKEMETSEKPTTSHGSTSSEESRTKRKEKKKDSAKGKEKKSSSHHKEKKEKSSSHKPHRSGDKKKRMRKVVYYETDSSSASTSGSDAASVTSCRRFKTGGSLSRRVKCRRVPQPRWVGARPSAKGGSEVAGDGRERGGNLVLVPARPTLSKRALVLPFIGVRRGSRCTMGGVAECYVSSGGELAP
jgi:hypothetical protein